jgi:hypothetical protein
MLGFGLFVLWTIAFFYDLIEMFTRETPFAKIEDLFPQIKETKR